MEKDIFSYDYLMQPAEGTVSLHKFLERTEKVGFKTKVKPLHRTNGFENVYAAYNIYKKTFTYDPTTFNLLGLFHEKQHLVNFERAVKAGIPLRQLFHERINNVTEAAAYCAELWTCDKGNFPSEFRDKRYKILDEYIHKARKALLNRRRTKELADVIFGYDVEEDLRRY